MLIKVSALALQHAVCEQNLISPPPNAEEDTGKLEASEAYRMPNFL